MVDLAVCRAEVSANTRKGDPLSKVTIPIRKERDSYTRTDVQDCPVHVHRSFYRPSDFVGEHGHVVLALGAFGWRQLRRPLKDWTARTRIQVACKGDPNRLVLLCVQEMEAWLARRGRGRASYQTLEEYAEELSQSAPRYHAPLTTLVELFSRVRYAEARLSSQEGASAFEAFSTIVSPENRSRSPEG